MDNPFLEAKTSVLQTINDKSNELYEKIKNEPLEDQIGFLTTHTQYYINKMNSILMNAYTLNGIDIEARKQIDECMVKMIAAGFLNTVLSSMQTSEIDAEKK
jgi:hypothetical protein